MLATGQASAEMQKTAAYLIPDLWRGRLPRGVSLNKKGRKSTAKPWHSDEKYAALKDERNLLDEYQLMTYLSSGRAGKRVQINAARGFIEAISRFRIYEKEKPEVYRRPGDFIATFKSGLFVSILMSADKYNEQGSKQPIRDAMVEAAEIERCSIDKIKREYRGGFEELRPHYESFAAAVDALVGSGVELDAAMSLTCEKSDVFSCFTPFMLQSLYSRVTRKS